MNSKLLEAADKLAEKAASSNMGHEAQSFANAANLLVQAAGALYYIENPAPLTSGSAPDSEGGTD